MYCIITPHFQLKWNYLEWIQHALAYTSCQYYFGVYMFRKTTVPIVHRLCSMSGCGCSQCYQVQQDVDALVHKRRVLLPSLLPSFGKRFLLNACAFLFHRLAKIIKLDDALLFRGFFVVFDDFGKLCVFRHPALRL